MTISAVRRKDNSSAGIPDTITAEADSMADINRAITAAAGKIFNVRKRKLVSGKYQLTAEISMLETPATVQTLIEEALVLANLGVTISASPTSAAEGANIVFTITVTNASGGDSVAGVVATLTIPTGLTVTANNPAGGTTYLNGVWTIGTVAANTSKVLTITADGDAGTAGTQKTVSVSVDGTLTDSSTANNTAAQIVSITV